MKKRTLASDKTRQVTLLLVDDSPDLLAVLVDFLRPVGWRLVLASDGQEGYQKATVLQPDLILLDVWMPRTDGFAAVRLLKADPRTRDIPVIFLSGAQAVEERLTGLRLGAVDYVSKPFSPEEVLVRINIHIAGPARHDAVDGAYRPAARLAPGRAGPGLVWRLRFLHGHSGPGGQWPAGITAVARAPAIQRPPQRHRDLFFFRCCLTPCGAHFQSETACAPARAGDSCRRADRRAWHDAGAGRPLRPDRAAAAWLQPGGTVEIAVADQGPGVPLDEQAQVFERYYRSPGALSHSGIGIGLHIVKRIVTLHGGTVWLDARYREGARFVVRFSPLVS